MKTLLLLGLLAAPALAQTPDVKRDHEFGGARHEGTILKPGDQYQLVRRKPVFGNQIKVRANFVPELQKSLDHL